MKKLFNLSLSLMFTITVFSADIPAEIKHLTFPNTSLKFEMLSDDKVKVTDDHGQSWIRILNRQEFDKSLAAKTIIFDMLSFDTSLVDHRLKYFASVPVGYEGGSPLIVDTDGDSLMELVGFYKTFDMDIPVFNRIFEQTSLRSNHYIQAYEQLGGLYHAREFTSDLNQNGLLELAFRVPDYSHPPGANLLFYESPQAGELATKMIMKHRVFDKTNIKNFSREVDLDRDGIKEVLYRGSEYIDSVNIVQKSYVAEYNDSLQTLQRVFSVLHNDDAGIGVSGDFAVHDFDLDGKMEFVTAENNGTVYWMEHTGVDNDYHEIQQIKLPLSNAYFHTEGDDLDGDSRPECFIGGDGQMDGKWGTVLACFETSGDNQFEICVVIMLAGLGGLNAATLTQCDVDGDGQKEIVLSYGGSIVVLESTGHDDYEIKWLKHTHYEVMVSVGDATGDGIDDLVRGRKDRNDGKYALISDIFTIDTLHTKIKVRQPEQKERCDFEFSNPHPNPFNSSIKINWVQLEPSELQIIIYNISGQRIALLANELFDQGVHTMLWDGTNEYGEALTSGIYFCRIQSKSYSKTAKIALMR